MMGITSHLNYAVHRIGNLLYIRIENSFKEDDVNELLARLFDERREFKGTAFLQIIDIRKTEIPMKEGKNLGFGYVKDPNGLNPASSVLIVENQLIESIMERFMNLPKQPVYPVTYRHSCAEAFKHFIEQGLLDENRAAEWHLELKRLLPDRNSEI